MRKATAGWMVCLAASFGLAATVLLAQSQPKKNVPNASATRSNVTQARTQLKPLNVKTGLWQMTQKVTWTGLPPQYAALLQNAAPTQYKSCVKASDLIENPWSDGSGQRCTWTVLNSDGTDMKVQGSCQGNEGATVQMQGQIHAADSQDGTGSMDLTLTMNGMTAKGHASYTGKWIGSTCPADTN